MLNGVYEYLNAVNGAFVMVEWTHVFAVRHVVHANDVVRASSDSHVTHGGHTFDGANVTAVGEALVESRRGSGRCTQPYGRDRDGMKEEAHVWGTPRQNQRSSVTYCRSRILKGSVHNSQRLCGTSNRMMTSSLRFNTILILST